MGEEIAARFLWRPKSNEVAEVAGVACLPEGRICVPVKSQVRRIESHHRKGMMLSGRGMLIHVRE
jgi:hypothetical protein